MFSSARLAATAQLVWQGCSLLNVSGGHRQTSPVCSLWGRCFGLAVGHPAGSNSATLPFLPARAPCCFTSSFQLIP